MLGFRSCGNCSSLEGLVGTPLKKKLVQDKNHGYCSKCKHEYYIPEADFEIGDFCPRCKDVVIKQKHRFVEYCPNCGAKETEKVVK